MHWSLCMLILTGLTLTVRAQLVPRHIGSINITYSGFSNIYEHPGWVDPTERFSLLISTFLGVPFSKDSTYMFEYVGKYLEDLTSFVPTEIYDDYSWPREPSQTPEDVFGFETITQTDGFLVPGKNNGTVYISDIRDRGNILTYNIVQDPLNPDPTLWFYHRVTWKDINNDGLKDALTCRVTQVADDDFETEMIWFQHPSSTPLTQPWNPTLINQNICGTFQYEMTFDLPGEGPVYALFTVGYFTHIFAVHWSTAPDGSWLNQSDIQTRVIDTGHQFFDIDVADLNKDGRPELLVTWNAEFNGSFVVYEIPDDFRTDNYTLHILADGFMSRNEQAGGGTPGVGLDFYPSTDTSLKPWIVLSGDDDGRTYYLTPQTEDVDDWTYNLIMIRDEGPDTIMGRPSTMDVDGDGFSELFIPVYYGEAVEVYTFQP